MAFGTAPSFDLIACVPQQTPDNSDQVLTIPLVRPNPATDLSPPILVRQRAIGADPSPGLSHPIPPSGREDETHPSAGPRVVPFDGYDNCPLPRRTATGEPPVPEMDLNDCAHAISRIANNDTPPLPACARKIALRGIARMLEVHARCSHDAEHARSLRECVSALHSLTQDTVDYTLCRAILLEIKEIIYED